MSLTIRTAAAIGAIALALAAASGCARSKAEAVEDPAVLELPRPAFDEDLAANLDSVVMQARRERYTYLIGPDDLLRVSVWQRDDISKEGVVRDDGTFFVPLAGNVPVGGKSVAGAQDAVRDALAGFVRDPQVGLEIVEYRSQVFFANGEFRTPGAYPIKGTTTVLEAMGYAGGMTPDANLAGAYLVRDGAVVPIDFIALFTQGRMAQNLPLSDGDLLYVPNINLARVYVLGEVLRPTAVPVRRGRIPLAQAIAEAGGFNEITANKRAIKIIRGGLGAARAVEVNYADVLKGENAGPALEAGDIVFVPATGLAKWDRALNQILPNLSRIVVDAAAIDAMSR
ncbi:SLBB domain-containing protein [bacterium]|nr:SLBB domain-containing protein [bacterium]